MSTPAPGRAGRPPRRVGGRRDRRGRGVRGMLTPLGLPVSASRSDRFDAMVLAAVEHVQPRVGERLREVEFAVEDVPGFAADGTNADEWDVLDDNEVPLSRLYRTGLPELKGPVVVLYRRPLETRARRPEELADLIHDIVVEQVARLFDISPDDIDPPLA
ncbi:metallopeptidase family protein [Jatrophihabitans telluris]|uniref:Metallopeptidase family protein n=1 Tax=Jatrophihabitans telluris TaxID=2038343 RepID=A0ABY4QW64_9ACTN|nr:metallopeptidase family protein [Jatrophihabitans telluris]UQX87539.1 metallopeptidase family protein [Jatrophihabitans telluris]